MHQSKAPHSLLAILDDVFMILLAVISAGLLVLEYLVPLTLAQTHLLDTADITIACIFLAEFVIKFFFTKEKGKFFKSHWWELLASIPITSPATQVLRLLRLLRLIRLFRLDEGVKEISEYLKRFFKDTHLLAVLIVWISIVCIGTLVFFRLEHITSAQHPGFFDSFWWSISTMMMSSPADIYPMTSGGRILAIFLTFCGLATTGIFTALVASFFITDQSSK